jgi:hypothetical protein
MTSQILGVQEIIGSKSVVIMSQFSIKFEKMIVLLKELEKEIDKNNLDNILSVSQRNRALKIEKLDLKRRIQFQIDSYNVSPENWKINSVNKIKTKNKKQMRISMLELRTA